MRILLVLIALISASLVLQGALPPWGWHWVLWPSVAALLWSRNLPWAGIVLGVIFGLEN